MKEFIPFPFLLSAFSVYKTALSLLGGKTGGTHLLAKWNGYETMRNRDIGMTLMIFQ